MLYKLYHTNFQIIQKYDKSRKNKFIQIQTSEFLTVIQATTVIQIMKLYKYDKIQNNEFIQTQTSEFRTVIQKLY